MTSTTAATPAPAPAPGNAARVLRLVHEEGPITRAEITRRTGLNRSTTLALVGELVDRGLLHEDLPAAGAPGTGVGRPSPVVRAAPDVVAAAVTVEVDAVSVALVGLDGTVRSRLVEPQHRPPTPGEAVETVAGLLDRIRPGSAGTATLRLVGIGVAVPGTVRVEDGTVQYAPHLGWHDAPFAGPLAERTGLPVRAANDANVGAWAERLAGSGRGVDDLVYLNGGASGIGGGVITAGRPLSGADGYAGELGHTFVAANGIRCHCGAVGCLETEASRDALATAAGTVPDDLVALAAALAEGRPEVERVVDRQVTALATALRNAIHTVNPSVVVLGGFLGVLLDHVGDRILDDVRAQSMTGTADRLRIVPAALGSDVLVHGAAEIAFGALLRDPDRITDAVPTTATPTPTTTHPSGRDDAAEEARSA
ncbi:ROK family transcriptional regulator [Curtobacterium sp. YR515]|uniref:ROK family transcriptional regulator n=1 Tax=Curtobacterium sp. YR515 TaxID=1855316 RepID=UPI0008EC7690|nr:ROK family transcriptional regulator [Curtobacterium sp. YR515]SFF39955.1 Sugar kinase of the NBD/HSP70 family, may contain an N-terminal HTH domain [Curtobacterium sp. YR515]